MGHPFAHAVVVVCIGLLSNARAQPTAYADPEVVLGAASEPVRVHVRGTGFTDSVQVIVDDIGVAIRDRRRYEAVTDTSFRVALVLGAEAAPWTLRVQNGDGGEPSPPFGIRVVPPAPEVASIRITAPDRRGVRRLSVYSRGATRYSYLLWRGDSVATTPLLTSDNSFAVTLGLAAEVRDGPGALGDLLEPGQVQIVTPGPGGGVSTSFTAPVAWTPLVRRWQFWSLALLVCAAVGVGVGLVVSLQQSRDLQRRVYERTAEIESARADQERQADALEEALATQAAQASALQEAAENRARAFAGVTHDLRTPLAVVLASLDGALARDGLAPDDRMEVEAARRASDALVRLSASLGEAARHEAGQFSITTSPLDVAALARDVVAEQAVLFDRLGVSVHTEGDAEVWVRADAWAVRRVLTNLLDNAGKFTPDGGEVAVAVDRTDGGVVLTVRDSGPGFDPAFVRRAFEPYVRGEYGAAPGSSSREGVGLGLSVVRDLTERMGGVVRAEPGPGGRVAVAFLAAEPSVGEVETDELAAYGGSTDRPLVLVAEDDPELRDVLARALREEFEVEAVPDGRQAFEAARRLRPAVVVSDIMMPDLDGVGLVRSLRAEPWGEAIPVVLVTALDAPAQAVGAFAAGADDYVAKPFSRAVLLARVRRLVGGRPETTESVVPVGPDGKPLSPDDARLVEAVRSAIEDRLSDADLDVVGLGRAVGLSKAQLGRRLRDALDESPAKYVERVRLDHAAGLLRTGGRLVKEVAGMVGYRDVKTFSRAFKRQYGASPSQWGDDSA